MMKTTLPGPKFFVCCVALIAASLSWPTLGASGQPAGAHAGDASARGDRNKVEVGEDIKLYKQSHALIVGESNYKSWPPLYGAKRDVGDVETILKKHGFEVTVIMDPTREQVGAALGKFINITNHANPSRFLFYFTGHGYTQKKGNEVERGYIVPSDAPLPDKDPAGFAKTALSMNEMETFARSVSPSHVLFVFDSCFSGSLFTTMKGVPESITDRTSQPVRLFITAGTDEQPVPDESIFRAAFVKALSFEAGCDKDGGADRNNDGYVTGGELGEFLYDTVAQLSNGRQTPRYGKINDPRLNQGDFVFATGRQKSFRPFNLETQFYPSGWMGDVVETGGSGNLAVSTSLATIEGKPTTATRIEYKQGRNKGWAGIYWQHPEKNWGDEIGLSLAGAKKISFYAKGERGGEIVEFLSGGITNKSKPYQDKFRKSLGKIPLAATWTKYVIDLSDLTNEELSSVIGGFAWVAVGGYDKEGRLVTYLAELKVE